MIQQISNQHNKTFLLYPDSFYVLFLYTGINKNIKNNLQSVIISAVNHKFMRRALESNQIRVSTERIA